MILVIVLMIYMVCIMKTGSMCMFSFFSFIFTCVGLRWTKKYTQRNSVHLLLVLEELDDVFAGDRLRALQRHAQGTVPEHL